MLTKGKPTPKLTAQQLSKRLQILVYCVIGVETLLTLTALVPAQLWVRILPQASNAALSGPFPAAIAPFITLLLYLLPSLIGLLTPSWQRALLYATLPAWVGLGLFLVAANSRVGAFYLLAPDHVTANVSVLEIYAALGGLGWLARNLLKLG